MTALHMAAFSRHKAVVLKEDKADVEAKAEAVVRTVTPKMAPSPTSERRAKESIAKSNLRSNLEPGLVKFFLYDFLFFGCGKSLLLLCQFTFSPIFFDRYVIFVAVDNNSFMGENKELVSTTIQYLIKPTTSLNRDGISIRFLNDGQDGNGELDNLSTLEDVSAKLVKITGT